MPHYRIAARQTKKMIACLDRPVGCVAWWACVPGMWLATPCPVPVPVWVPCPPKPLPVPLPIPVPVVHCNIVLYRFMQLRNCLPLATNCSQHNFTSNILSGVHGTNRGCLLHLSRKPIFSAETIQQHKCLTCWVSSLVSLSSWDVAGDCLANSYTKTKNEITPAM